MICISNSASRNPELRAMCTTPRLPDGSAVPGTRAYFLDDLKAKGYTREVMIHVFGVRPDELDDLYAV